MKKSLVALAVLAASGASIAQVSITGNLTAGFQSTTDASNNTASGLGVDNAEIVFSATEDLGAGLKASAKLGLVDASRGNIRNNSNVNTGFGPGDSELAISGGFGKLALSTSRGVDYLSGGVAGVAGIKMDERVFGQRTSTDSVSYLVPVGPVSVGLSYSEPNDKLGLGLGTSGLPVTSTASRQVALAIQYADGPLVADAAYLSDENVGDKGHYRASASYDFGVVKVAGGLERAALDAPSVKKTTTDMLLGVSVPMGALTLGANWAQRELSDQVTSVDNGSYNGYGLKASYALSKRTALSADYANWSGTVNGNKQSQYNVLLSHSF